MRALTFPLFHEPWQFIQMLRGLNLKNELDAPPQIFFTQTPCRDIGLGYVGLGGGAARRRLPGLRRGGHTGFGLSSSE